MLSREGNENVDFSEIRKMEEAESLTISSSIVNIRMIQVLMRLIR